MTKRQKSSLYFMVKEKILNQMKSGVYSVGHRLPTESEMCEQYHVSRTTVRMALQELEQEGILERIQGRGTFIKKKEIQMFPTRSFADDVLANGKKPSSKVIEASVVPAKSPFDDLLQIPLESALNKLVRVRYADDDPLLYEECYIPWSHAPGLINEITDGSLYDLLQSRYQLKIRSSVEKLKPVLADQTASMLLGIREGVPCFQVTTISYLENGQPLEYSFGIFRGDVTNYVVERFY